MDNQNIDDDLAELHRRIASTGQGCDLLAQLLGVGPAVEEVHQPISEPVSAAVVINAKCGHCCCDSHCRLIHPAVLNADSSAFSVLFSKQAVDLEQVHPQPDVEYSDYCVEEFDDDQDEDNSQGEASVTDLITSLYLNLE